MSNFDFVLSMTLSYQLTLHGILCNFLALQNGHFPQYNSNFGIMSKFLKIQFN